MIPFDGRRTFGAPEYFAELPKDRRPLTKLTAKAEGRSLALTGGAGLSADISAVWRATVSSVSLPILLSLTHLRHCVSHSAHCPRPLRSAGSQFPRPPPGGTTR